MSLCCSLDLELEVVRFDRVLLLLGNMLLIVIEDVSSGLYEDCERESLLMSGSGCAGSLRIAESAMLDVMLQS